MNKVAETRQCEFADQPRESAHDSERVSSERVEEKPRLLWEGRGILPAPRRAADLRADGQIGSEKLWDFRRVFGQLVQRTVKGRQRSGAPSRRREMFPV